MTILRLKWRVANSLIRFEITTTSGPEDTEKYLSQEEGYLSGQQPDERVRIQVHFPILVEELWEKPFL